MSICCRGSYRALSRSRLQTLTPFLYQTSTLQPWNAAHPIARRNASSRPGSRTSPRPRFEHDVPFEDELQAPTLEEVVASRKSTTITGSERAAFEKLYKKFKAPEREKGGRKKSPPELDQIADEWWEDDDEKMSGKDTEGADLDSLFDAAMSGKPHTAAAVAAGGGWVDGAKRRKGKRREDLATLAMDILKPDQDEAKRKLKQAATQRAAQLKTVQEQEKDRIKALLEKAETDKDLWEVLQTEVFDVIKSLNLDVNNKQNSASNITKTLLSAPNPNSRRFPTTPTDTAFDPTSQAPSPRDPRVLFHNYPYHLIYATKLFRLHFPTSPLPFSILPTLKAHGRSSYALGATTSLYKLIIRAAWRQTASYTQICSLLQDMDNGGIECDSGVLNLIDEILVEYSMVKNGRLGRTAQVVLSMEVFGEGVGRLKAWREVVAKRLGVWADKRMKAGGVVRKINPGEDNGKGPMVVGPRDEVVFRGPDSAGHGDVPFTGGVVADGEDALSGVFPAESGRRR